MGKLMATAGVIQVEGAISGGLGAVTSVKDLGARNTYGIDYYLVATKLLLDQSLMLNATVRATKANQMGILGFGGDKSYHYEAMLETSAAYLLNRKWVMGAEYRMKPRNLGADNEKDYYDAFLAWFPSKNLSLTVAYVSLGDITIYNPKRQEGVYLSVQAGFRCQLRLFLPCYLCRHAGVRRHRHHAFAGPASSANLGTGWPSPCLTRRCKEVHQKCIRD